MSLKINLIKKIANPLIVVTVSLSLLACNGNVNSDKAQVDIDVNTKNNINIWPVLDIEVKRDKEVEANVLKILASMTLEQKVAQMIQPEIKDITVEDMRKYGFGSYLNGGGAFPDNNKYATPTDWIRLAENMY